MSNAVCATATKKTLFLLLALHMVADCQHEDRQLIRPKKYEHKCFATDGSIMYVLQARFSAEVNGASLHQMRIWSHSGTLLSLVWFRFVTEVL